MAKSLGFPLSGVVPRNNLVQRDLPVWVAVRSPESHDCAVANGCNVVVALKKSRRAGVRPPRACRSSTAPSKRGLETSRIR